MVGNNRTTLQLIKFEYVTSHLKKKKSFAHVTPVRSAQRKIETEIFHVWQFGRKQCRTPLVRKLMDEISLQGLYALWLRVKPALREEEETPKRNQVIKLKQCRPTGRGRG